MNDYKWILEGFIQGGKKEELYIRRLVKQIISMRPKMEEVLRKRIGDDYEEEIISELRYRLIKTSKSWKSHPYIYRKYLISIVKNLIVDLLEGEKIPTLSLQSKVSEEEAESITYEDLVTDIREAFAEAEGNLIFEKLIKSLKEQDIVVLCYYFNKNLYGIELELRGISKSNLYKRWERLKERKLRDVFADITPEEFKVVVERFLSQVCKGRGYIK